MKRPLVVGVMGGGQVDEAVRTMAYRLGALIAESGWVLLNGGRSAGVMDASAQGAADNGGLTVGILPDENTVQASKHIRIPICTGMGSARNSINVLSSDVVVACPGSAGTVSEIALALKHGKVVITIGYNASGLFDLGKYEHQLVEAATEREAVDIIRRLYPGNDDTPIQPS